MNIIELNNVSLYYHLDNDDAFSLKNAYLNYFFKAKTPQDKYYKALNNICFKIAKGEKVGIVGLNGAGKSTLLRVMSQIFFPSEGQVTINGQVSPLLNFATGFESELNGIENIKIRLMFLGLQMSEVIEKLPEVIEFADLGEFIYQPVRTYSSGMFLRLAFATSTAINPEILVADEIIGTGDSNFATKAKKRLDSFLSNDNTCIISSHDMGILHNFCNRVIWLHHGEIIADGPIDEIIKDYEANAHKLSR